MNGSKSLLHSATDTSLYALYYEGDRIQHYTSWLRRKIGSYQTKFLILTDAAGVISQSPTVMPVINLNLT